MPVHSLHLEPRRTAETDDKVLKAWKLDVEAVDEVVGDRASSQETLLPRGRDSGKNAPGPARGGLI